MSSLVDRLIRLENIVERISAVETPFNQGTWSPTFWGWSVNPTGGDYRYVRVGKLITLFVNMTNGGTSNNGDFLLGNLPYPAATVSGMQWQGTTGQLFDNSTLLSFVGLIALSSGSSTLYLYMKPDGTPFTASGAKRAIFTFQYQCE